MAQSLSSSCQAPNLCQAQQLPQTCWVLLQAVIFLTLEDKQTKTLEDITQMCPALSLPQLHRIATTYRDDQFGTKTVSQVCAVPAQNALDPSCNEENSRGWAAEC